MIYTNQQWNTPHKVCKKWISQKYLQVMVPKQRKHQQKQETSKHPCTTKDVFTSHDNCN